MGLINTLDNKIRDAGLWTYQHYSGLSMFSGLLLLIVIVSTIIITFIPGIGLILFPLPIIAYILYSLATLLLYLDGWASQTNKWKLDDIQLQLKAKEDYLKNTRPTKVQITEIIKK